MKRSVNTSGVSQSKLEQIKSGSKKVTQIGDVSENKKVIHGKDGKFHVTEKVKKTEETGVRRKKRNYVMYESKLGTEREKNLQKIHEPKPKEKPKPAAPKPRQEEKIIQKKKKVQYLDNYQYHETKDIKDKNPNRVSIVTHQRLGDIVGGSYEETTYQKHTMTDTGKGQRLYSQQSAKTTTRRDAKGRPTQTSTQRSNTASRTLPAKSQQQRKEVKKYSSNTNLRSAPKKPAAPASKTTKTTTTKTTTTRTTTKTTGSGKPTTVTKKTVTRSQSAGKAGRRH
jgi:hypothetical protein